MVKLLRYFNKRDPELATFLKNRKGALKLTPAPKRWSSDMNRFSVPRSTWSTEETLSFAPSEEADEGLLDDESRSSGETQSHRSESVEEDAVQAVENYIQKMRRIKRK